MGKIKSAVEFVIGKDIIEKIKKSNYVKGERSLGLRVIDTADDIITFGIRYGSFALEFNGVRSLMDGHYQSGVLQIIIAEYFRLSGYIENKRRMETLDTLIEYETFCKEREALRI